MPPPPEFSPDPPDSREVFSRSLSPPLLHLEMVFLSILDFKKASYKRNEPALITDEGNLLMCWDPGIAVGLVACHLPLLLLEVEVKVLLQILPVALFFR